MEILSINISEQTTFIEKSVQEKKNISAFDQNRKTTAMDKNTSAHFYLSYFSGLPNEHLKSISSCVTRLQCHLPLQLSLAKASPETDSLLFTK